jgi:hypothetical protein
MLLTADIQNKLRDPLGYFDEPLPEPVLHLLGLWADRLQPEMEVEDFISSYFVLLEDLQTGWDSTAAKSLRDPLVGAPAALYRLFFAMFGPLVPRLVQDRAHEIETVWRRSLFEIAQEETF